MVSECVWLDDDDGGVSTLFLHKSRVVIKIVKLWQKKSKKFRRVFVL